MPGSQVLTGQPLGGLFNPSGGGLLGAVNSWFNPTPSIGTPSYFPTAQNIASMWGGGQGASSFGLGGLGAFGFPSWTG